MKSRCLMAIFALCLMSTIFGCSSEEPADVPREQPAISLSPADKEKVAAFREEMVNLENMTDKVLKLAGSEIMNMVKGGEISVNLPDLAGKAGAQCRQACEVLAKKAIPGTLPPEIKTSLTEARDGLVAGYKAYGESFAAINTFMTEKKPLALIEYKQKSSQAKELITMANDKLGKVLATAGIAPP